MVYVRSTRLVLSKHYVNLLLQSFRSVSSYFYQCYNNEIVHNGVLLYTTHEDLSLRIGSFAIKKLRGVSTKLN